MGPRGSPVRGITISSELCNGELADHSGGITNNNAIRRNVSYDDATGPHDRVFPDDHAAHNRRAGTYGDSALHRRRHDLPILLRLKHPSCVDCSGIFVVDEGNVVTDEYFVFNRNSLANERVTRDLDVISQESVLLNLYEGTYFTVITDATSV